MKIKANNSTGVYYAHITGSNPINLKTRSRTEAVRLAKAAKLEELEFAAKTKILTAEAVQRLSAGGKVSGAKALNRWRELSQPVLGLSPATIHSYDAHINRFLVTAKLNDRPISMAEAKHVDAFVNAEDDTAASTRQMRKASLDSFFKVCLAEGYVLRDPGALVRVRYSEMTFDQKEPTTRTPFTEDEVSRLLTVQSPFWGAAIRLSLNYGLRLSDVAQLEWSSFDRPDKVVIWTDKRDRRIVLPRVPDVDRVLPNRTKHRYVFPDRAAVATDMKRRAGLSVQFSRILRSIGIEGKSFHCLRHTFATQRAHLGDTTDEIRLKLGHVDTATTEIYVHA